MSGLLFQDAQPAATSSPNRADVVCFVGLVGRRSTPLSVGLQSWLCDAGWWDRRSPADDSLLNVPVPVESFEAFDQLFAWEQRPPHPRGFAFTTWLGAAVRAFFRQGGARCFIVRVGDPFQYALPLNSAEPLPPLAANLARLLPGLADPTKRPTLEDPSTWKGIGVMCGLEEAAFVCLPDLPELVADTTLAPNGLAPVPPGPEVFVPYAPYLSPPDDEERQISSSPACSEAGYLNWRKAAGYTAGLMRQFRRDTQVLLSLPLPGEGLTRSYTRELSQPGHPLGLGNDLDDSNGIATAFLQLAYPWVATAGAEALPGGLEPPDGTLAGVIARAIPELGVAHSAGRQLVRGVHGFEPLLAESDLVIDTPKDASPALIHRVSLIGRTADGVRLLSDVTTSRYETHRPACVSRLTAAILRTARALGETVTFEPAGEALWEKIRTQLERLLADFYAAGALSGDTVADAFTVRCDDTTTTANDFDNGRIVAEVKFSPAYPIGLITVVLALREGTVTAVGNPA